MALFGDGEEVVVAAEAGDFEVECFFIVLVVNPCDVAVDGVGVTVDALVGEENQGSFGEVLGDVEVEIVISGVYVKEYVVVYIQVEIVFGASSFVVEIGAYHIVVVLSVGVVKFEVEVDIALNAGMGNPWVVVLGI